MNHVHFDDTQENHKVTEAADDSVNTSVNKSLQLFKSKILNAIEIITFRYWYNTWLHH